MIIIVCVFIMFLDDVKCVCVLVAAAMVAVSSPSSTRSLALVSNKLARKL